jgi:sugar phosphate isomerase/epimerase
MGTKGEPPLKFAFSTLGCPGWNIEQAIEAAKDLGYGAIELRLLDGEVIDPAKDVGKVMRAVLLCRACGVEVCALDTSCRLNQHDPYERARQETELRSWIHLAYSVKVPILRVFGGVATSDWLPAPTPAEENTWMAELLSRVAGLAELAGITIGLETHDAFHSSKRVANILQQVNSPQVATVWDICHTYRSGDSVAETLATLDSHIALIHIKDARSKADGSWQLTLMGEGEVPVAELLHALQQRRYAGYVSVEWEKKWVPELPEPEVALPQHMSWLKNL